MMSSAWIQTFKNVKFDIMNPKIEMVLIEDIAHALSLLCRFTGHTKFLYTVGQHSLLGSYLVPSEDALDFLLHDASEAYIGDLSRPLKHLTPAGAAYIPVEEKVTQVIRKRFGLEPEEPETVKIIDNQMLYAEKAQLMGVCEWSHTWGLEDEASVLIEEMSPRTVEAKFLNRFHELNSLQEE